VIPPSSSCFQNPLTPSRSAMIRHFLDLRAFATEEIRALLAAASRLKARRLNPLPEDHFLEGRRIVLVFEQPSLRTRMSFEIGIRDLGGDVVMVTGREIELGERESLADTARVMGRYVDGMMIRMLDHAKLETFAHHSPVPVINGLSKTGHPCQVLADLLTFEEHRGEITGRVIAWVGDSNNVQRSWIEAAARLSFTLRIATPPELAPDAALLAWARAEGARIETGSDPFAAVTGADCVIADSWVSMGDTDAARRHALLAPFQANERLMSAAAADALFMHCLPAKRGEEVTDAVLDGPHSVVFDEAENRLHAQKAVLAHCFGAEVV